MGKTFVFLARLILTVYLLIEAWHGSVWAVALLLTLQCLAIELMSALLIKRGKEYWW